MIDLGRETCGDLREAESREWLCAGGTGGFASGTMAGLLTRRQTLRAWYLLGAATPG
jgi:hypothetical protein